jgi:hypothetical protein
MERRITAIKDMFKVDILIGPMCQYESYADFVKGQVQFQQQTRANFFAAKQDHEEHKLKFIETNKTIFEHRDMQYNANQTLLNSIQEATEMAQT